MKDHGFKKVGESELDKNDKIIRIVKNKEGR